LELVVILVFLPLWHRMIVMDTAHNKRLRAVLVFVGVFVSCATVSASKDDSLMVQGPVVAIQRGRTDTRIIEPPSFADLAEIYMVRPERWSTSGRKEKYILVEYIHQTGLGLIEYKRFENTRWNFVLHPQSSETNQECLSWVARGSKEELTFIPTTFGANLKLPDPGTLSCFLVTERPSAAR
jgi:hypothetical protein